MLISNLAFKLASQAISTHTLKYHPDRVDADASKLALEWELLTSTIQLQYFDDGRKVLTYRTPTQPTKEYVLSANNLGALACHSAKKYMDKEKINPLTATPEDFVNILLALEEDLIHDCQYTNKHHVKNG